MSERTVVVSQNASSYHRIDNGEEDRIAVCGGFKETNLLTLSETEALRAGYDPCNSCRWVDPPENTPEEIPDDPQITASPGNSRNYHTNPETCKRVNRSNRKDPRPATEAEIRYHDLTPCPDCSLPDYEPPEIDDEPTTDRGETA